MSQRFAPYRLEAPLARDPDRRPFEAELDERLPPKRWNQIDNGVLRPISQVLAPAPAGEAINVNAIDEVPDSSWFENRIGRSGVDRRRLVLGPCREPTLTGEGPWTIVSGKPGGAAPGFVVESSDGRRYLIKLDGLGGRRAWPGRCS